MITILKDCGEHGKLALTSAETGKEMKFKDQGEAKDFLIKMGVPVIRLDDFTYEEESES